MSTTSLSLKDLIYKGKIFRGDVKVLIDDVGGISLVVVASLSVVYNECVLGILAIEHARIYTSCMIPCQTSSSI
jgi:hypothetical protein